MGSKADFIAATLADTILPIARRPVEDIILETLDQRQIPNRTDFKELRDLVNSLRGQLGGATAGIKKVADTLEELEDRVAELDEQAARLSALEAEIDAKIASAVQVAVDRAVQAALAGLLTQARPGPAPAADAPKATTSRSRKSTSRAD